MRAPTGTKFLGSEPEWDESLFVPTPVCKGRRGSHAEGAGKVRGNVGIGKPWASWGPGWAADHKLLSGQRSELLCAFWKVCGAQGWARALADQRRTNLHGPCEGLRPQ